MLNEHLNVEKYPRAKHYLLFKQDEIKKRRNNNKQRKEEKQERKMKVKNFF